MNFLNLSVLVEAGPVVMFHVVFALAAFVLGLVVLFRRKGGRWHKLLGKTWVGLMAGVALTSFFIHDLRTFGPFSPIHLLSVYTLGALAYAVWAIRNGNVKAHQSSMRQIYALAIVVTGAFTFLPQRLMAHTMGDGIMAKLAPVIWVLIPLTVYAIYRARGKKRPATKGTA